MALSISQKKVADHALAAIFGDIGETAKGFTIIGEGGTGKTYTVAEIVRIVAQENNVLMVAPTHKAVKQMQKSFRAAGVVSSRIAFRTVHSALGLSLMPSDENKFAAPVGDPIIGDFELVVCDEASMLNKILLENYLLPELTRHGTFLLLMGDDMQLPPVRETRSTAFDLFKTAELTENRRQLLNEDGSENGILKVAREIRHCIKDSRQFKFVDQPRNNIVVLQDRFFLSTILERFNADTDMENTRVLAWRNFRVDDINRAIRHKLYGPDAGPYVVGERVITKAGIKNGEGDVILTTGEECLVSAVSESEWINERDGDHWRTLIVTLQPCYADIKQVFAVLVHPEEQRRFDKEADRLADIAKKADESFRKLAWSRFWQHKDMFDQLGYCAAMTLHNAQGSTFDTLFLDVKDLLENPNREERQRLLYVGWSRPRNELVINKAGFVA